MQQKPKNRFTFKIIFSYLVLAILALSSGYFIYSEISTYLSRKTAKDNDLKLLKTSSFLTYLYEAESLSKLALQDKTQENFKAYSLKIDSISTKIDTLKQLTNNKNQKILLDSVHFLLQQKLANINELINLRVKNDAHNAIDNAIEEFSKMEASLGKITAEGLAPNIKELSPKAQKVIRDVADYLNANVPENNNKIENAKQVDSIIKTSKLLLAKAKKTDSNAQQFLTQKESEINSTDLELSQQLRQIIAAFEQEILVSSYNDSLKKKLALKRSIRLAGFTALIGLIIVSLFSFLINRDFWRVQTYRQKLEKEKKYSESLLKSREQLMSTVSHDLRTPLNTISGYTELMQATPLSKKQTRYISTIKSSAEYVNSLVNDLLEFSKLEGGKLNIENIPFIAADLIEETAKSIKEIHKNKNIALFLDIDLILKQTVLGDPFRIRQILTNLIGNAFKFTKEGHVKISAKTHKIKDNLIEVHIEIKDTGIGIAKEKQHLIFEEFTQAEATTEKKFGGYGLGLTISKKLTELLGGKLSLESKLNKGSTFSFQLPLSLTDELYTSSFEANLLVPKLKILIIDDDTALLEMLRELAEGMGITASTFTNFSEIEQDSHLVYDLVLTDIQMPQINGFKVLEELKSGKYKHYNKQPIIAMTGKRDLEPEAYISTGFSQVLEKPFSKQELVSMLKLLGFKTEKTFKSKTLTTTHATQFDHQESFVNYNLEIIQSFLGANDSAVNSILKTFLRDTKENMILLENGITANNYPQINDVAHRMLPMFRQLKAIAIVSLLECLELAKPESMNKDKLVDALQFVKRKVGDLIIEMESNLQV